MSAKAAVKDVCGAVGSGRHHAKGRQAAIINAPIRSAISIRTQASFESACCARAAIILPACRASAASFMRLAEAARRTSEDTLPVHRFAKLPPALFFVSFQSALL